MTESINHIKTSLKTIEDASQIPQSWLDDSRIGVQNAIKSWFKAKDKEEKQKDQLAQLQTTEKALRKEGYSYIAGVDEVGRGPLAGPVVAAAVILPADSAILGINDSKKLSEAKRNALFKEISSQALSIGIGIITPTVIDELNIYQATKLAMQDAVEKLTVQPDYLLIDAMEIETDLPQQSLIKGDANSYAIAAASIVAKVVRDTLVKEYSVLFPGYGFEKNVGYGTKEHLEALEKYGVSPFHRKSFEPVKTIWQRQQQEKGKK